MQLDKLQLMKKNILLLALGVNGFLYSQSANVGINTITPDASAILEVSADPAPNSTVTTKKGLLIPRIALQNIQDVTTIAVPTNGLLVMNTTNNGTQPNNVVANTFYYWNGTVWERVVYTSVVQDAVNPRIFYIEGNDTQTLTSAQINYPAPPITIPPTPPPTTSNNVVTFTGTPIINTGNIFTFNDATDTFTVNITGLYDFSCFVNYNPMATTIGGGINKRAFLNLKIQTSPDGTTWTDSIGSRTGWGTDGAGFYKTALIPANPLSLTQGTQIRLVIANPFDTSSGNNHASGGFSYIGTDVTNHISVSKGMRVQLLNFNLP